MVGTHLLIMKDRKLVILKQGAVGLLQNFTWKHCDDFSFTVQYVCSFERLISFQLSTYRKHCELFFAFLFLAAVIPMPPGSHTTTMSPLR